MQKVAWSITEISQATGLSIGFLRNDVRNGRLPVKKFGRRVLVLQIDLQDYLQEGSCGKRDESNVA
jgi:hypothetical protein